MTEDRTAPTGGDASRSPDRQGVGAREIVILALGAGATYLIGLLLWPFAPAILTSATLAALVYPAYERLEAAVGNRDVAALLGTAVLFFAILIPLVGLSLVLVDELRAGIQQLTLQAPGALGPESAVRGWLERWGGYLGLEPEQVSAQLGQQMEQVPSVLADRTLSFLSGLGGWLLQ
ncbi:MAG: AI-2E family transporter, partial [Gemmatimonadota bacterium]